MYLSSLTLLNIRVIKEATLKLSPGVNFILGDNGSGKTSCLEAISILSQGRSFRTHQIKHVIHHEAEALVVSGRCHLTSESVGAESMQVGIEKKKAVLVLV